MRTCSILFLLCACLHASYGRPEEASVEEDGDNGVELLDESVDEFFDLMFANIRHLIIANEVEPIILPSDSDNFTATLFNSVLDGNVWIGDGEVTGLSSLHRTGNMAYQNSPDGQGKIIEGLGGFTDLEAKYSTHFHLGPFHSNFGVEIKISFVSLDIIADVTLIPTSLYLRDCHIDSLSTLQVKLKGLGIFDSKMDTLLINTLTQLLEPLIVSKIEGAVCDILLHAVNGAFETTPSSLLN